MRPSILAAAALALGLFGCALETEAPTGRSTEAYTLVKTPAYLRGSILSRATREADDAIKLRDLIASATLPPFSTSLQVASYKDCLAYLEANADKLGEMARVLKARLFFTPDSGLDSLDEMSQEDALALQAMMEKKAQLEAMISNVMKKSYETSAAIVQNLKDS